MQDLDAYIPGSGHVVAHAKTRVVAASDEDQPVLRGRCADSRVDGEGFSPVLKVDGVLDGRRSLCCRLVLRSIGGKCWDGRNRRGHSRGRLGEIAHDLVDDRKLLLSDRDRWQCEDDCR